MILVVLDDGVGLATLDMDGWEVWIWMGWVDLDGVQDLEVGWIHPSWGSGSEIRWWIHGSHGSMVWGWCKTTPINTHARAW